MRPKRDNRRVRKALKLANRAHSLKLQELTSQVADANKRANRASSQAEYNLTERFHPILTKAYELSIRPSFDMYRSRKIVVACDVDLMYAVRLSRDPMANLLLLGQHLGVDIARGLYEEAHKPGSTGL